MGPALGAGLRGFLLEVFRLRADGALRRGETWAVPGLYRGMVALDPGNEVLWDFLGYQMAYNLSGRQPWEREEWTREALQFVQEGLLELPESTRLHVLEGRIYSRRLWDPDYSFLAALVREEEGRSDLEAASAALWKAIGLSAGKDGSAWLGFCVDVALGGELTLEGDLVRAVRAFERAAEAARVERDRSDSDAGGREAAGQAADRAERAARAVDLAARALAGDASLATEAIRQLGALERESGLSWAVRLRERLIEAEVPGQGQGHRDG
jgi:hypothetical protein